MNSFARAIYLTRLEKGLSQKTLASKAGVPQPNLSKIEKGRDFKVSTLLQIASALDVSVEDLIRGRQPADIDKRRLFQRENIEKAISCVVHKKEAPMELRPAVRLISAVAGKGAYTPKRDAYLAWYNLKRVFSNQEIQAILSRLGKARRRAA